MTYLSYRDFDAGFCDSNKQLLARLHSYPFIDYAAISWGIYAREACNPSTGKIVISFLDNERKRDAMSQGMLISWDS
jgi:hypothetical protein